MEDRMSGKLDTLDVKALLGKNQRAAKVFKKNKKKLGQIRRPRERKEYSLGLPYARPVYVNDAK